MASFVPTKASCLQARNSPATTSRATAGRMAATTSAASLKPTNGFMGCTGKLGQARPAFAKAGASMPLVQAAASKETKAATVEKLKAHLEESSLVVGLNYQGLSVKDMQAFRRSLPADANLVVCKNTLISRAGAEVEGWGELSSLAKGDQAWMFVGEEIAPAIKAIDKLQKEISEDPEMKEVAQITGGIMEGNLLDSAAVESLKKLPTKIELMATIARLLKQPVTKIAVGVNQVPTKVGYGVRAIKDKLEEEEGGAPASE